MKTVKRYAEQRDEIRRLTDRINTKITNFARQTESPYFGDLGWVLEELKELDHFLSDEYLK